MSKGLTYRDAGVDIDAGNELIKRIAPACKATHRPEMLSGLGGFAALAELPSRYEQPVLVTGTDGVGTKLKLAIDHNRHDSVGQDLVAMCANDVLVTGAEPFLFLDYYATGKLDVDVAERVINGIAHGCQLAGCALVGGETAEMPGFYGSGDYDLAGFCIGVVERQNIVHGKDIAVGHKLIGLASSGPHSNGYSLIRRIVEDKGVELKSTLLDELMAPTRIYAKSILALRERVTVAGMAHITGGGLIENLPRMFTDDNIAALVDLDSWTWPTVFNWLAQAGNVEQSEMLRTFNCGIGFVLCVEAEAVESALEILEANGENATVIGEIVTPDVEAQAGQLLISAG
ncbi:MAG: phosphoribosylformylglycinamidine cyclo-ligase [Gammaproteobacteria bacterium]|nr:phosphoribosylformylglycinamidine cyclo-ligase [Gammaproteobacteria bacterium]